MPRYYFDVRDNDELTRDDDGLELPSLARARDEASLTLVGIAKDVLPRSEARTLAIEVRTASGPVLRTFLHFKAEELGAVD
ncbi:hypothetical protein ABIB75_001092 [Bradyrhizobium sp. GM2.2]